jgi:ribosomal protein S18 acetylase RimI-like enzyme
LSGRAAIPALLPAAGPIVEHDALIVEPARREDLAGVVELHKLSFPHFFMTALGDPFLEAYYKAVLQYPHRLFYLVRRGPDVAGFVAGFATPSSFYALLQRRRLELAICAIRGVLRNPGLFARLVRGASRVRSRARPSVYDCELSSIGVHPGLAGQGIGRLLLESFTADAVRRGINAIVLSTDARDNDRINRFYRNYGFVVNRVYFAGKREMNEYVLHLRKPEICANQ